MSSPPAHGTLTGAAPYLVYTAKANYSGADSFTFRVIDSDASFGTTAAAHVTGEWSSHQGAMLSSSHRLVVGKITWGAEADKIEVFLPFADMKLPDLPSSELTVYVDQSTFDTLQIYKVSPEQSLGPVVSTFTTTTNLNQSQFGTLQLGINAGAVLTDPAGNPLDTTVALVETR